MNTTVKTLSTKRLILRQIDLSYERDYFEGFVDYEVIKHMNGRVPWPYPKNGVREFFEREIIPHQGKTIWQWGIFLKDNPDKLIGSISIRKNDEDNRGFWLAKQFWGHGYMTEASNIVTQFAFEELGFEVLHFTNARGNIRSRRIKEKAGARLVKMSPMKAVDPMYTESEHWELTKTKWLMNRLTFTPLKASQQELVLEWLRKPHVNAWFHGPGLQNTIDGIQAFVTNTDKTFDAWMAYCDGTPFAFLMTFGVQDSDADDPELHYAKWVRKGCNGITLDLLIGDENYLRKSLSVPMIKKFISTMHPDAKTVFIDPECANSKAIHVYEKAGFKKLDEFIASWHPVPHVLMRLNCQL
jgi:RimJ/RimL family protein N-acetyltransferase